MINKKIAQLVVVLLLLSGAALAQEEGDKKTSKGFHIKQHVMITMKDGSEVEGVIHSHISKNKYWVRQYHTGHQGKVKAKFLRALSDSEVSELKKKKK